eukprot:TRINITY_DN8888_c0_g1_i1.p2 TRINITY_DN8888_c0_g1~~TRINITY_DN8888_c0_g1_i1.p2  ORF type:complete len:256 (+),score=83.53 TRINITY_DN8888_c0_g1_i1:90-770(+)
MAAALALVAVLNAPSACYEAYIPYTVGFGCKGYEEAGYACQGQWCAVEGCQGHCSICAMQAVSEDFVVDPVLGRCAPPGEEGTCAADAAGAAGPATAEKLMRGAADLPGRSWMAGALLFVVVTGCFTGGFHMWQSGAALVLVGMVMNSVGFPGGMVAIVQTIGVVLLASQLMRLAAELMLFAVVVPAVFFVGIGVAPHLDAFGPGTAQFIRTIASIMVDPLLQLLK